MKNSEVPVLIVGGGAAGTMLSLELARRGIEHRCVDRLAGPPTTSRAITVHARTAEIIERIDTHLIDRFLEHGIHNKGYVLHFVDGQGRRAEVRPGIDFTGLDCRYPYFLVHGQSDTENYLREYTHAEFGKSTQWNRQCIDVEQHGGEVAARLVDVESGAEELVTANYLVACDGINSRVRRCLGLGQDESDYAGTVLQNLDAYLEGFPDVDDYVHYCAGTDHFIMIVRLPGGFYRMLLSDRGEAADPNVQPERAFMRLVDQHFDGVSIGQRVWHSRWESWVRLADTYRHGNVFLAGDSAHVHSTTGGQGMNCCMQDAYNLGWKLALVIRGHARPELLESYETERRPIAEQVIWAASSLHEIFMGHGKDIGERARKMADPGFLDEVVGRCSGISYTYKDYIDRPEQAEAIEGPAIGDRAPDAALADGESLFSRTRHTGHTLLGISTQGPERAALDANVARIGRRYSGLVNAESIDQSDELAARYGGIAEGQLLLIRPDGYIGFRCRASDSVPLEQHLARTLIAR